MTFEHPTFSPDSKFDECFKHFVVECEFAENPCSTTNSYAQTAREHRQTSFSQIQPITQTTVTYERAA